MQRVIDISAVLLLAFLVCTMPEFSVGQTGAVAEAVGLRLSNKSVCPSVVSNGSLIITNLTENSWTTKAAMPTARYSLRTATVNGIIYAIGGFKIETQGQLQFSDATDANEAYNPATDTWTKMAPMPTAVGSFAIAAYQNKIYCIGGAVIVSGGQSVAQQSNFFYDPATNSWETKASLQTPESGISANTVDGKIYVIGNLTEVYDPTTNSWTNKTAIPTVVSSYVSAVVDGKIFVFSGASDDTDTIKDLTQIYNPATDTWSVGASIPMGVFGAAAVAITDSAEPKAIYVFGGSNASNLLMGRYATQVYFPDNNSWSTGASMPKDKTALSVAVVDNVVYALGGGHNIFSLNTTDNMQYTPFGIGIPAVASESPSVSPSPSPSLNASPNPSLSSLPTVSSDLSLSPSTSPNSPTPTEQNPTLTPSPSQNPEVQLSQTTSQGLPQEAVYIIAVAAVTLTIVAIVILLVKSRQPNPNNLHLSISD